jgi:GNAT superfamily N-acetyltransferase
VLWHSRRIDAARVLVLGVVDEYRGRGLDAVLYADLYDHGASIGLRGAELSWVLEDNHAIRKPIEGAMGARPYKTYRIYEMSIGG